MQQYRQIHEYDMFIMSYLIYMFGHINPIKYYALHYDKSLFRSYLGHEQCYVLKS